MGRMRFRLGARGVVLSAAAFAFGVAALILWLGGRYDRETDRIAAEGRLAQGWFLSQTQGSCASDGCDPGELRVGYAVDGVTYRTSMLVPARRSESKPLFETQRIDVPRLGPERPYQVVYLPSDPAIARLREDLGKNPAAIYGTAGMFGLAGLVFGAVGLFGLRRGNRLRRPRPPEARR